MANSPEITAAGPPAGCSVCAARRNPNTTEVFVLSDGPDRHFFNVDKAKWIVADGRSPIPISEATVEKILAVNEYDPQHLSHVDPAGAGVLALRFGGAILLDGIHRAARCVQEGRTFHAYMLHL